MIELKTIPNLKAANFDYQNGNNSFQIQIIVSLLKKSIENKTPITLDDIISIHAEYAMKSRRNGTGFNWFIDNGEKKWRQAHTKDEWIIAHSKYRAIVWFKQNLGNAILKGKILGTDKKIFDDPNEDGE